MVSATEDVKILIAASGTGGHLFPARFIAEAILKAHPSARVEFIGSGRPLEKKLIESRGFKLHSISVKGVKNLGIHGGLSFLINSPRVALSVWKLLSDFRPDVVVGVGGYATFFPIVLSRIRGIPTWIHEAEIKPGLANWALSFFSTVVSTAFEEARMPTRRNVQYTGHPVREGLSSIRSFESISKSPTKLLVLGGSQGAQGLDITLPKLSSFIVSRGIQIRHQCRDENREALQSEYRSAGVNAEVVGFIDDMNEAYRWADVIVSRSGAGSVAEIGVVNKPVLLVPFPRSAGGHQVDNAMTLVRAGKALLEEEGEGFLNRLEASLSKIFDVEFYNQMRTKKVSDRGVDSADRIAKGVLGLGNRQRKTFAYL